MKTNVIIIGGGAIGLCSAYYLHNAGASVTVIEKGDLGHGSSLHNAGYVCPSHFIPLASPGIISQGLKWMLSPTSPFYMKPRLDPGFISWAWKFKQSCTDENVRRAAPLLCELGNASLSLYKEFARRKDFDFEWTERGLVTLYRTDKSKHHCEEEAELAEKLGIRAQLMNQGELQKLVSDVEMRAAGGLYFPDDCHMTPALFVSGLARHLQSSGVTMLEKTEVTGLTTRGGRIAGVETANGAHEADDVVLAGGSWSPLLSRFADITLPLQAGKGYSVTIPRKERKPLVPLILSEARVAVTSMGETIRFAGTMELAGIDLSITQRRVDAILNSIHKYIGGFQQSDFAGAEPWAGLRPVSPDGVPYIGRFSKYPNLIAATGHAMVGISLAPITGQLVSEIVAGIKPSIDISLMNPDRFA